MGFSRWPLKGRIAAVLGGLVLLGGAGMLTYMELVKAGYIRYNEFDRRVRGSLRVGEAAPDLTLSLYDGSEVRLSELWGTRPLFLIFGSCT